MAKEVKAKIEEVVVGAEATQTIYQDKKGRLSLKPITGTILIHEGNVVRDYQAELINKGK